MKSSENGSKTTDWLWSRDDLDEGQYEWAVVLTNFMKISPHVLEKIYGHL